MRSQHVAAFISLVCALIGGALALAGAYGTAHGWWRYPLGLEIALPGFAFGLAGAAAGGLWLARALGGNNAAGWKFGAVGFAASLLLAGIPLNQARLYLFSPPIHDISTDPEFPPPFKALLALRAGATNGPDYDGAKTITYQGKRMSVLAAQKKAYLDIRAYSGLYPAKPGENSTAKAQLFWHAYFTAQNMGWNIVGYDEKAGTIEATAANFWFGLISDVAIRVKQAGRNGAWLDIRAKSRDVENDMGINARLVRSFRSRL